ncbi:modification methylase FokI [Candidatus Uhrbacteria bacterium RIFCSPHIGHO2_02_FULL_53_13]|uniref:site-specific DNA-methyltransferase (adenine-specific) n=1 Tax=Candidatus Uhrbacteria bacterium RIFCSPHIGHO2_02_FULL_53_13 TaxID=1802389 RepID=A0A1F7U149_9BACT|nr:MAG: modification methylase FokI [Candidatus Uhrbacteria bacterium RIFCSPHIGHO2_02_FULL_53_13]
MKYIGNKTRLLNFINESIIKAKLPQNGTFIDIFGGTGSVGKYFKNKKYKIIANDFMTYSYIAQYVLIKINKIPSFEKVSLSGLSGALQELNSTTPKSGYIFNNFAPSGIEKRQYFSDNNARKIDAIRDKIENWRNDKLLSDDEYYILVYSLINAADFVANISGTYGAYLKIWRSMALKDLELKIPDITNNDLENEVVQEDANSLIKKISGDILYLDPPYNERQYAPNFHILETLAVWDKQKLVGKTGQRDYSKKKSAYSQKTNSIKAFEDLIANTNTNYIILSYNNEGIIPRDEILRILNNKGKVSEYTTDYRRFRTERDHKRRHYKQCDDKVVEHLYIIKVDKKN